MTFTDFLLFIFYAFIYYRYIAYRAAKDELTGGYLKKSYQFRVLLSFCLSIFVLYISPSDAGAIFFPEAKNVYHQILADPSKLDFFINDWEDNADLSATDDMSVPYYRGANFILIKFITAFCFISFGNFVTISFLFSLLAFEGAWKLFTFFNQLNPALHKYTAICFLFIPTYVFWTAGIVKEALSIFCLGYITYLFYNLSFSIKSIVFKIPIILLLGILLYNVKSYTLIAFVPIYLYFIVKYKFDGAFTNKALKYGLGLIFVAIFAGGIIYFVNSDTEALQEFQLDSVTQTLESQQTQFLLQADDAGSSFNLGVTFDPSPAGLAKSIPFAIAATFFRPFLWEAKKITTLISAAESLFFLLATLYVILKCGFFYFLKKILTDPLILFCFVFAIFFGFFCGISTLNFGSLVRYKLPCIPFYLYALVLIYLSKFSTSISK